MLVAGVVPSQQCSRINLILTPPHNLEQISDIYHAMMRLDIKAYRSIHVEAEKEEKRGRGERT